MHEPDARRCATVPGALGDLTWRSARGEPAICAIAAESSSRSANSARAALRDGQADPISLHGATCRTARVVRRRLPQQDR